MKNNTIWMSFSDLMSCLMIIFMFVSISYIRQVVRLEQAKNAELKAKTEELERIALNRKKS